MAKGKKIALTTVIAVVAAALIGGGAFAWSTWKKSQAVHDYTDVEVSAPDTAAVVNASQGRTVQYNGHTYQLNENMVSMVFMGIDKSELSEGSEVTSQADAIMVVAMDTSTGAVHVIAIPRTPGGGRHPGQQRRERWHRHDAALSGICLRR